MTVLETLLSRRRMLLTATVILSLMGLYAWFAMPRQEDPTMPDYWANVVAVFPGATAEQMERLILNPIEEHLAEVEEIKYWRATAQSEQVLVHMELHPDIGDTDDVWDDVKETLEEAAQDFPDGAQLLNLNSDLNDQEAVVLAVTGSNDVLELAKTADAIKDRLLSLREVSEVLLIADPEEQVTITFDDDQIARLGMTPQELAGQLQSRNTTLPGGSVKLEGRTVNLSPKTEFPSIDAIRETPINLPGGGVIPLAQIASVYFGPEEPARSIMRYEGVTAVGVGVVPQSNVHLVTFGEKVREEVENLRQSLDQLEIHEVAYLPGRVQSRLNQLGNSLAMGIGIVGLILLLAMGLRLGMVVAMVVPLVAFAALGIFSTGGGILHQTSIAALVIALGMLVDNAIVVAENIQWRIDRGTLPHQAALESVRELAAPLGSATATTLAAFVPMLINKGTTADFTRALPVVIMLTLTVSYLFAIFVTPALSELFLRKRKRHKEDPFSFAHRIARIAVGRPALIMILAILAVGAAGFSSGLVKKQFFPSSDRNQVVVDVKLPEGTHLEKTSDISAKIEQLAQQHEAVKSVSSFVGRSAPHFYYNLSQIPWRPHFAQILITTNDLTSTTTVVNYIRNFARDHLPEAIVIPKKLEQGPPIETPIEVRLFGKTFENLNLSADMVLKELRAIEGTVDNRHNISLGSPNLAFHVDDYLATKHGLSRAAIATSLFGRTRGLPIGQYRAGDDPVPVLLRSSKGEHILAQDLDTVLVTAPGRTPVPLASLARIDLEWRPAAINHRNRQRVVTVSAQLMEGFTFSQVQQELEDRVNALSFPSEIRFEFGGEAEGSGEANASISQTLPIGLMLLFAILLAQFNSFRRVGVVLITVPLAATGVIPGLLLGDQPFGFMSFLGVISLIGVVVNNAIVLLDVIESQRKEGATIEQALQEAIVRRTRPILLTTATTVAGLLPLALSDSSLWPPLALAMISGLIASTMLTLLVVPALYLLLFKPRRSQTRKKMTTSAVATVIPLLLMLSLQLRAQELPQHPQPEPENIQTLAWEAILEKAGQRPAIEAGKDRSLAVLEQAKGVQNLHKLPQVNLQASANYSNPLASIDTPNGRFTLGERVRYNGNLFITQPLLNLSTKRSAEALFEQAKAAMAQSDSIRLTAQREAVEAMILVAAITAQAEVNQAFIHSLESQFKDMQVLVANGAALESDLLKVKLALAQAKQLEFSLREQRLVAAFNLGRVAGMETPIKPRFAEKDYLKDLPTQAQAQLLALANRPELAALEAQARAISKQEASIQAENKPQLNAQAGWLLADGDAFRNDSSFDAGIILSWNPFNAGYRKKRQSAKRLEGQAAGKELLEAKRSIAVEIRTLYAQLDIAKQAKAVAETSVEMAIENLRVERQRHSAGRTTTNDLLVAEAMKRQRDSDLVLAKLDILRSALNLKLAIGK